MHFKMRTATSDVVQLVPGNLTYGGNKKMVEFSITDIQLIDGPADAKRSTKTLVLVIERDFFFYITQSFLTTFILGMLAYSTFFINIDDFNDRFMGSLTGLLVLATLTSVYTEDLPRTSYFKVIDLWLQFFVISTAVNITVHIVVDYLRKKEDKKVKDTRDPFPTIKKAFVEEGGQNKKTLKPRSRDMSAKKVNEMFIIGFPIVFVIFILFIVAIILTRPKVTV